MSSRILLSPPHLGPDEARLVSEAIASNWIAPVGPHVDEFERALGAVVGAEHALAVASGTAALHLALRVLGIGAGDQVAVSTLTFVGSVAPIAYQQATPVFIDSDEATWNMDPGALELALDRYPGIKAVIIVHLYGQSADLDPICEMCRRRGVLIIEDAAEALGTTYRGRQVGTFGDVAIFSFNGNKIITTSSGGALVANERRYIDLARKLATQARDPAPHYQHSELGYNYRMSNLLAALGLGQLRVLRERVAQRRRNFQYYARALSAIPGLMFMPEAPYGTSTRWLTTLTIDPATSGVDREAVRTTLEHEDIESRPVWKPMHQQPALEHYPSVLTGVADRLFADGLCLPSGSNMTEADLERVVAAFHSVYAAAAHNPGAHA